MTFQIVDDLKNIPYDGIIGEDFLKSENANLSYNQYNIKLNSLPFSIPLHTNITDNYNHLHILQPRSQTIIEVDVNNKEIEKGIILEIQVKPNVFSQKHRFCSNCNQINVHL